MPSLPGASVSISAEAGALAGGTGYCVVIGCVETNDDITPRVYTGAKALIAQHGYSPAVDYAALHIEATKKPVLFVGLPKVMTGTSVITVAAGANGVLEEVDASITVVTGGTIGVNGISFNLSLDGGRTEKLIKLGTATSYTIPYVGIVLSFAAGTLVAEDVYTFRTSAPMWDSAGMTAARAALAAQMKLARSFMVIGDITDATTAGYVTTALNTYETSNERFAFARVNVYDRLPLAKKSKVAGETLTIALATDTITRSAGSWVADGYKVGDVMRLAGTVSNDGDHIITTLTPTVATFSASTFVDETIDSIDVDADQVLTMAAWVSALDAAFATVDAQKRIDIGLGRLRKLSPITAWEFRRPVSWAASIREYQHDVHIPTWRKEDGPLLDWSNVDEEGNIVEYDARVDGGALAGRFTCARTWANGPNGAFIAMSLTRDTEGSLLSLTHNMAVANVACTVVQQATENIVGKVLQLDDDGHATTAALGVIEESVNTDLEIALLQEKVVGEGPRASKAVWTANTDDVLNVVDATLTGACELHVNGTIVNVETAVKVS
jgi:hypothetical protein